MSSQGSPRKSSNCSQVPNRVLSGKSSEVLIDLVGSPGKSQGVSCRGSPRTSSELCPREDTARDCRVLPRSPEEFRALPKTFPRGHVLGLAEMESSAKFRRLLRAFQLRRSSDSELARAFPRRHVLWDCRVLPTSQDNFHCLGLPTISNPPPPKEEGLEGGKGERGEPPLQSAPFPLPQPPPALPEVCGSPRELSTHLVEFPRIS